VRALTGLMLICCLPLLCGCQQLKAATDEPSQALWSAADAQQALDDLRAIREQSKILAEIKQQTAAANAAIATLNDRQAELIDHLKRSSDSTTDAVAKVSSGLNDLQTDIDGVEQRLDNPAFPPAPPAASSSSPCVTIGGIDYDIPQLIADWYTVPWTWEGSQDEKGLKDHLAGHGVTGIDKLPLSTLKGIHAAVHEKEMAANGTRRAVGATGDFQLFGDMDSNTPPPDQLAFNPPAPQPSPRHECPNGQCPQVVRSKSVTVTKQQTSPPVQVSAPSGSVTYQPARYFFTRSVSSCSGGRCKLRRR
jgi:hypothetical protein